MYKFLTLWQLHVVGFLLYAPVYLFPYPSLFTYNRNMQETQQLPYLWDYNLDAAQFYEILNGRLVKGRLNQDWATRRVLEYASYDEIIRLIGYKRLVENWSRWRGKIRSKSRVRGFDFLVKWLPEKHPEYLRD